MTIVVLARHEASPPLVERIFQAMKSLLRPSAHAAAPRLAGPWLKAPAGRYGTLNPRKALGRLFERLAPLRRDPQDDAAARMAEVTEALGRLSHSLLPVLVSDERARRCRRRGPLAALIARVASDAGLQVSPALAQAIFQHMENEGLLEVKGRDVTLQSDQSVSAKVERSQMQSLHTDLPMLEAHAKKRLERRKQRQQARQATKRRKKQT
eukprot:s721_g12.t1